MNKPIRTTILRDPQDLLAAPGSSPKLSGDEINLEVQRTQDKLLDLERQRELIERQKKQLEELKRKQHEFEHGQHDIAEKLTRGLVTLERQEFELKRETEQIQMIRQQFADQLHAVESLQDQEWEPGNLSEELTRALAAVDQAKAVFAQADVRLASLKRPLAQPQSYAQASVTDEFTDALDYAPQMSSDFWVKVTTGFAYSLPGLIGIFLFILFWMVVRK
jgi:chromosome segregation ATPase